MLELSDPSFKTTIIKMLRALMDGVDSMQEQTSNVSREMEVIRKPKRNAKDKKRTQLQK